LQKLGLVIGIGCQEIGGFTWREAQDWRNVIFERNDGDLFARSFGDFGL
jgi:hypothetical protein